MMVKDVFDFKWLFNLVKVFFFYLIEKWCFNVL